MLRHRRRIFQIHPIINTLLVNAIAKPLITWPHAHVHARAIEGYIMDRTSLRIGGLVILLAAYTLHLRELSSLNLAAGPLMKIDWND
jgi:hypothetical protein